MSTSTSTSTSTAWLSVTSADKQLPDEEMATYRLRSQWDDFYLVVLAAIAASLTASSRRVSSASPIAPFAPREHSSYNGGPYGEACLNAVVGAG